MSLAEPRKRRKNPMHSINLSAPNHWTNDDSKFGQRMLEKFGWTKGSGLGKNKQGISENIRVQHKVMPTGLGFIAHNADDWFKAGEDYSRLLSQLTEKFDQYQALSEAIDDTASKKSLVQNSLNSRSRVHYHKFTKGKDLTQYKREELRCILGKGVKDDQSSSGLNMKEYFKTKRSKKMKIDELDTSSNEDSKIIIDDEINEKCTAKKDTEIKTEDHEINNISQKKKKRDLKLSKEIEIEHSNAIELKKEQKKSKTLGSEDVVSINHSKKKKISKTLASEDIGGVNKSEKKKKKSNALSRENMDDELAEKKKSKAFASEDTSNVIQSEDNRENSKSLADQGIVGLDNHTSECSSNDMKTVKEQYSELVLTHKYQNLVDLLIENSSAGKKYCKDSSSPLFEEKIKEFADSVKHECSTTVGFTDTKSTDGEIISNKPVILNPDDKNFVKDFEAQKSKVLEIISKRQGVSKYINEKSMFIAKHGDVLFFGSNINDIKGYGDW